MEMEIPVAQQQQQVNNRLESLTWKSNYIAEWHEEKHLTVRREKIDWRALRAWKIVTQTTNKQFLFARIKSIQFCEIACWFIVLA
jgi:hypothetical protein